MAKRRFLLLGLLLWVGWPSAMVHGQERPVIQALYIPLADHYAALVAYEKYRHQMTRADFRLRAMASWPQLRGAFQDQEADLAFVISPMAMEMFSRRPDFRWVSLMHRDGNALVIDEVLHREVPLPKDRQERRPDQATAEAFRKNRERFGYASIAGVPSLLSTHVVVLYKFLRDHHLTLGLGRDRDDRDVVAIEVPPAQSVDFLRRKNAQGEPAAIEQSLPWAEIAERAGAGRVAWYSRDLLPWPHGHVECIAIAQDRTIRDHPAALLEVVYFIHRAARDIEQAREAGGQQLDDLITMIRRHVPQHPAPAIAESLRADRKVINYRHLDPDQAGLRQVMELAVEGGILRHPIDIDAFTDSRFRIDADGLTDAAFQALDLSDLVRRRWPSGVAP